MGRPAEPPREDGPTAGATTPDGGARPAHGHTGAPTWDVVYVVRDGDRNEPLRHSLRSVAENLSPIGRVWLAGNRPAWCNPDTVGHVDPGRRYGTRYKNSTANLRAALRHGPVADSVVYMNDDFYLTDAVDPETMPLLTRGTCEDFIRWCDGWRGGREYVDGHRQTADLLADFGYRSPLSFESHTPFPIPYRQLADAILDTPAQYDRPIAVLHKRTLLGNFMDLLGAVDRPVVDVGPSHDVKIAGPNIGPGSAAWPDRWPFVSTAPAAWKSTAGEWVRDRFPDPCIYEKGTS